jgi:hypothetical protein
LVKLPWHVFENGPRRDMVAEESAGGSANEDWESELANERLRDLGYID